jgi:hypothetical protein
MKPSWKNFACAGLFAVLSSPVFAGDINFCIIDAQNPSTIGDIFPHEPVVLHCFNREGDEATNKLDTCAAASKDGLGTLDSETLDICLNSPADAQHVERRARSRCIR